MTTSAPTSNFDNIFREAQRACWIKAYKDREGVNDTMYDAITDLNSKGTGYYCAFVMRDQPKWASTKKLKAFLISVCRHYKTTSIDIAIPRFKRDYALELQLGRDEANARASETAFSGYDDWRRDVLENTGATDFIDGVGVDGGACDLPYGSLERADWIEEHALELVATR